MDAYALAAARKSCPHFLHVVFPRFTEVPQTGHKRRSGLVMNQMTESTKNPISQMQNTSPAPSPRPASYPAPQSSMDSASRQASLLSETAYAITNTIATAVKTRISQLILRHLSGFMRPMPPNTRPIPRQIIAQEAA